MKHILKAAAVTVAGATAAALSALPASAATTRAWPGQGPAVFVQTDNTAGNAVVEEAIMLTRKSIEGGETIAAPLKETAVFPAMVVQMIGVGEATGALDTMLQKIADFYEEEVDVAVAGLLTLLEPIMIAFLGGVVGGIVIAMYLPIFDLISKLTG